ncbi:hypothetical protein MMC09_006654 [Bachmanniomyces sp. S44760]|nr:hypothetical protein [Bachmanniomyces sp. S44760]
MQPHIRGIGVGRGLKLYAIPARLPPQSNSPRSPHPPEEDYKRLGDDCNKLCATTAGAFGAVAGIFALFFFSDVPKVKHDIMEVRQLYSLATPSSVGRARARNGKLTVLQKLPVIGDYFHKEIPPSDNPF